MASYTKIPPCSQPTDVLNVGFTTINLNMVRFEFRKERIVTSPQFHLFFEFTDLWKWDRQPGKPKANKLLFFVFLLCDLTEDNPLRDVQAEVKWEEALYRTYGNKSHKFTKREVDLLGPAVRCYIKYNRISEERILESFDSKAQELRETLELVVPETHENEKDGVTAFVSNSAIITKGLKELDSVKKLKMNVINAIRREAMSQRVRGQAVLSPLAKGVIPLASEAERHTEYEIASVQREGDDNEEFSEASLITETV